MKIGKNPYKTVILKNRGSYDTNEREAGEQEYLCSLSRFLH